MIVARLHLLCYAAPVVGFRRRETRDGRGLCHKECASLVATRLDLLKIFWVYHLLLALKIHASEETTSAQMPAMKRTKAC
jgi:hypothetical protein